MNQSKKADFLLFCITAIWGLSIVLMRDMTAYMTNIEYLFLRFLIASITIIILLGKRLKHFNKADLIGGSTLGACLVGTVLFTKTALNYTDASNVSFFSGMSVLFVPVLSFFLKKGTKIGYKYFVAILFAVVGLFFISGGVTLSFNLGDLLAFGAAICISLQILFNDIFIPKTDSPLRLGSLQIFCATGLSLLILLGDFVQNKPTIPTINSHVLISLLVTGIGGTALAFVGQTILQKNTTPNHVAIIFLFEPVFGTLFALFIPDILGHTETLSWNKLIGFTFIFISLIISEISGNESRIN